MAFLEEDPETANALLYQVVSDLVYERLTRRVERHRGHFGCASVPARLLPDCRDRFQDDVEAARTDLLRHADRPIANLGGWMTARLTAVTVDANRKRRGERGAQQRPRVPGWLDAALDDPWLSSLALKILTWVGVPTAAAHGPWPLSAWAEHRPGAAGDWDTTGIHIAADVERVLTAMRSRRAWYENYIERPLGRKEAPLIPGPRDSGDPDPLPLTNPAELADARLRDLAAEAINTAAGRIRAGGDPRATVVDVLGVVFVGRTGADEMSCAPGSMADTDETVARLLSSPADIDRVVDVLLRVVSEPAP
ncbi:hypothetical protein [Catenulispora pinisilvae]|uniref:hypothetical protein n=1 Tax=Catenulispora pinisilvae TaxID=2705253 RepID=UPI001890F6DA|nr:hypothetical protein [Catenulispora pinisilvae]